MTEATVSLASLKPAQPNRVIDLVRAAGIDVSDWANSSRGERGAAANPKYCYEWVFHGPGPVIVVNVWFDELREEAGTISCALNLRRRAARARPGVQRSRAERADRSLQSAARDGTALRVIVLDGRRSDLGQTADRASKVWNRGLDPAFWAVTSYNDRTGASVIVRGAPAETVDQFDLEETNAADPERRRVVTLRFQRDRGVRQRALDRARGRCDYCGHPGFTMPDGLIFRETHHVIPLSENGPDSDDNVAVLCPNHHREAHHGANADAIRGVLRRRLSRD